VRYRGIQLKHNVPDDEGFLRLLRSAGGQAACGIHEVIGSEEGGGPEEPSPVASKPVIARQLREELDDTLLLLEQALAAVGVDRTGQRSGRTVI